jgi:hypothetical protein
LQTLPFSLQQTKLSTMLLQLCDLNGILALPNLADVPCVVHVIDAVLLPSSLNTEQLSAIQFGIYPNPAQETVVVSIENGELKQVQLINPQGKVVLNSSTKTIDIRELPSGMYIMNIQLSDGNQMTARLMKN